MAIFARPEVGEYNPAYQMYLDQVAADVTDINLLLKVQGLVFHNLLKSIDDKRAEYRYQPDKWSIKEVVGHLIDTERLFAFRYLWLARAEPNEQPGMDENLWAANSNAHDRRLNVSGWHTHIGVCRVGASVDTTDRVRCQL